MENLMMYITRISRCANLYRNGKLEHEGLNGYQHVYILKICKNPGISQDRLAQMIYINKSNVTRQLSMLEQNGFITRVPCEKDRRVMRVFPTQKAHDIYPKVKALSVQWNGYLAEDFTEEQCRLLASMLERVLEKAVAKVEKEAGKDEHPCE